MNLSIIYCFKDRDLLRVQRSIHSVYKQLDEHSEIIFVDYGSCDETRSHVELFLKDYSKVKYIYVNVIGKLWNRSQALNIGVKHASTEHIITADIDLIFSSNFIDEVKNTLEKHDLINYQCYYLSEKFKKHELLLQNTSKYTNKFEVSSEVGLGLMAVKKELFEKVHGYDEYFRVWGMEDNDLNHRFELLGFKTTWLNLDKYAVFHQWHPISGIRTRQNIAKGWQKQMNSYFSQHQDEIIRSEKWGEVTFSNDIHTISDQEKAQYDLSYDSAQYAGMRMKSIFEKHAIGEIMVFRFNDVNYSKLEKTKSFKIIRFFNSISNRFNFPFLLESELYYYGKMDSLFDFRDVFHFFVLEMDGYFSDYQLTLGEDWIELIVKKNK